YRGPGEEVLAGAQLQPRLRVDPLDDTRVEPHPAGEDEATLVGHAEVDPPGPEVVGQAEQVFGGVHHVVGDAEGAGDDVGRAARQHRDRNIGPGQSVRDLVQGPVATEGDDDVVAAVAGLAPDLGCVVLRFGGYRLGLVAGLERMDDEVLEPGGDRRRVR